MGKPSREKGKRGERLFAAITGGIRTWGELHDVTAHGRPWEVKNLSTGFAKCYQALDEFREHEGSGDARAIAAVRQDGKPWLVVQYYDDWKEENVPGKSNT